MSSKMALENVDWTEICRACVQPLMNSPHSLSDEKTLALFNKCTGLNAGIDDYLPQGLCVKCNKFIGIWNLYIRDWTRNNECMWKISECDQEKAKIIEKAENEAAAHRIEMETIKHEQETYFDRIIEVGSECGDDMIEYEFIEGSSLDHQYTLKHEEEEEAEQPLRIMTMKKAIITRKPVKSVKAEIKSDVRVVYRHEANDNEEDDYMQDENIESLEMLEDYVTDMNADEEAEEEKKFIKGDADELMSNQSYKAYDEEDQLWNEAEQQDFEEAEEITNEPSKCVECTCSKCGASFSSYLLLENHCKVKHSGLNLMHYICRNCGAAFASRKKLQDHIAKVHTITNAPEVLDSKKRKCTNCHVTFASVIELLHHVKSCSPFTHKCNECSKEFKNKVALSQHMKLTHSGKQYICNECGHSYKSAASLSFHRRVHKAQLVGDFKCRVCHKLHDRKESLEKHMATAHKKKKFTCKVCGLECSTQIVHRMHMASHILGDEHKCDTCGRVFKMYSSLELHKPRCKGPNHTPQKRYYIPKPPSEALECPLCNDTLSGITEFKQHLFGSHGHEDINVNDVIQNMKKHQCKICGNKYLTPRALMQHTQIHGKKRHICNVCSKAFLTPVQLKSHVITHFSVEAIPTDSPS